jgi:cephalosporin hydroxylase
MWKRELVLSDNTTFAITCFLLLLAPIISSSAQHTEEHTATIQVTSNSLDNIYWIGSNQNVSDNILNVVVNIPSKLSNHTIHICVHHDTHQDMCFVPENFYYPLNTIAKEGFGTHHLYVYAKRIDLQPNNVITKHAPITIQIADNRFVYPDPKSLYTGIELDFPKENQKLGDGTLRIETKITSSWPIFGSICIMIRKVADTNEKFVQQDSYNEKLTQRDFDQHSQKVCTGSSMRQFNTNKFDSGHYQIQVSVINQHGSVLNKTKITNFFVLDAKKVTEDYHQWYFDNVGFVGKNHPTWLGVNVQKNIGDLWVYQEIIHEYKPTLYIEFGTLNGGSALYMANILSLVHQHKKSQYNVLTVDIDPSNIHPTVEKHKKELSIEIFTSSSISLDTENKVKESIQAARRHDGSGCVMISLDSKHDKKHVLKEMELVTKYLRTGDYLIVEDTQHNGHPIAFSDDNGDGTRDGPFEAVEEFDKIFPNEYIHDTQRERRFGFTWNPRGYLIKT